MASYKVIHADGVKIKGKTYAQGESVTLSEARAATFERLDFIKAEGAKKEKKAPAKAAKKAKKGTDAVTFEPTPDVTE
jgi:hypothetical protein